MIYFDNSATTKIDDSVLDTFVQVNKEYYGNPSSLHKLGNLSSQLLKQSRKQIANMLNVSDEEIYFTSGGTEGDNWAIKGTAIEKIRYGKHIITTKVEHPAVLETMKQLEDLGWQVTYLPVDKTGVISIEDLKAAIRKDTILVSVIAVNSEMGSVQPIKAIGELLKGFPTIHFHVDAVQALGKIEFSLGEDSRIDLAVFSGHKFNGPRGVGFVYKKNGRQIAPLLTGGGQEDNFRSGTENLPAIVAMAKAVRLTLANKEDKQTHLKQLKRKLYDYLSSKDKVMMFSNEGHAPHILCFGIEGIRGEVTVHALEEKEIFVSTTSACSSRALDVESNTLKEMGIPKQEAETAIRVSFSTENTMDEVSRFCEEFDKLLTQFEVINK